MHFICADLYICKAFFLEFWVIQAHQAKLFQDYSIDAFISIILINPLQNVFLKLKILWNSYFLIKRSTSFASYKKTKRLSCKSKENLA